MVLAGSPLGSLVEQQREQIVALALQHGARKIAVFGSVARGEDTGASDVDFLVEFEPDSSCRTPSIRDRAGKPIPPKILRPPATGMAHCARRTPTVDRAIPICLAAGEPPTRPSSFRRGSSKTCHTAANTQGSFP